MLQKVRYMWKRGKTCIFLIYTGRQTLWDCLKFKVFLLNKKCKQHPWWPISPHGASAGAPVYCSAGQPTIRKLYTLNLSVLHSCIYVLKHRVEQGHGRGVGQGSHGYDTCKSSPPSSAAEQRVGTATDTLMQNYSGEHNVWLCDHHYGWAISCNSDFHRVQHTGHWKNSSD